MKFDIDKILILSGLISFSIFLIIAVPLGFFYHGYDHLNDVISKQGAVDSPIMLQTNILFFLMGFTLFLFGIGLLRNYSDKWPGRIGSLFITIAGVSGTLVGIFPCDPGCIGFSIIDEIHTFVSELPLVLAAIGILFMIVEELRGGGIGKNLKRNYWLYIITVFVILSIIFGYIHLELDPIFPYDGLYQRIAIGIPLSLVAIGSIFLYNTKKKVILFKKKKGF
jgi:hypothetical membrane protein